MVEDLIADPLLGLAVYLESSDGETGGGAGHRVLHFRANLESRRVLHARPEIHFTHEVVLERGVLVGPYLPDNAAQLWNVLGLSSGRGHATGGGLDVTSEGAAGRGADTSLPELGLGAERVPPAGWDRELQSQVFDWLSSEVHSAPHVDGARNVDGVVSELQEGRHVDRWQQVWLHSAPKDTNYKVAHGVRSGTTNRISSNLAPSTGKNTTSLVSLNC